MSSIPKSQEYDERAAWAVLGLYNLAKDGGGHSGSAVTSAYKEALDAAESTFRSGMEGGDEGQAVKGWNQLTDITAHIAHAHARVATVLLATVVNQMGVSAEEVMRMTLEEIRKNTA
ncbi:hypothetical protein [Streptomyces chartreusis]|uniref:hypothetical protein n=1 Tax=Streptomyces chartreusis TaxID=1969 RepID=UPI00123D106A|nr:hypothetical protein [Streptomyces chartreusis]QEV68783.1 hypothetical protein CP983_20320 [Streptomyces chartreusis]GGX49015.1 hypothetical protein GCM10010321_77290 [Streptomyces chartreusis]